MSLKYEPSSEQVDLPDQAEAASITLYPILRRADLTTPEPVHPRERESSLVTTYCSEST